MRLIKDEIPDDRKLDALRIINKLKTGNRVFGSPAEGLKKTLKNYEQQLADAENKRGALDFLSNNDELENNIRLLKAGIRGEETLAEYMEKIVKYDDSLQDIIFFASLSDPTQQASDDYISDSDFVAVYGNHILIMDAKNIATSPDVPIYLDGNSLCSVGGKEILELHPSVCIWRKIFSQRNVPFISCHGVTVIVNSRGACIWKNTEWQASEVKPIHISELVNYLHEWIENKEPHVNLSLLTALAEMQIKKDDSGLNLSNALKRFGI